MSSHLDVQSNLYIAVAYILLFKLNYGCHDQARFISIFQTEHFLAMKFAMGYEENMSSLVIPKISKSLKKKKKKNQTGLL